MRVAMFFVLALYSVRINMKMSNNKKRTLCNTSGVLLLNLRHSTFSQKSIFKIIIYQAM